MELKGQITINGRTTEFMMLDEGGWTQWGDADKSTLGERVDLLDGIAEAYQTWRDENLCSECGDHLLDDGEGYDGKCGNCADRAEAEPEPGDVVEVDDRRVLVQVVEDMGYAYRILGRYVADDETIEELADVTLVKGEDDDVE